MSAPFNSVSASKQSFEVRFSHGATSWDFLAFRFGSKSPDCVQQNHPANWTGCLVEDVKMETAPNAVLKGDVALNQVVDCTSVGSSNMQPTRVWVESSPQPPRPWGTLKWLWWYIGDLVPIHHRNLPFQQQLPASASPHGSAAPLFSAETFLGLPLYLFQNWFLFWLSVLSFFHVDCLSFCLSESLNRSLLLVRLLCRNPEGLPGSRVLWGHVGRLLYPTAPADGS